MPLPVPVQDTYSVGQILTAASMNKNLRDAVTFLANPPLFEGYQGTTQSLANLAWTAITLDTNIADTYAGHSTVTNPTRYTAQVAGYYDMDGTVTFAANATGARYAAFYKNGATHDLLPATNTNAVSGAGVATEVSCWGQVFLAVGDYIELKAYQSSGAALGTAITSNGQIPAVTITWRHA